MIEVKTLQYFVTCAEVKSFSKAADVLSTTQLDIKNEIKIFENQMGFSVFARTEDGLELTCKAQSIYVYAYQALENVSQIIAYAEGEKIEK